MSSEPPRPQPKATLTLFCVLIFAVGAQSWSWSVLARYKREQMKRQHINIPIDEKQDDSEGELGVVLRLAYLFDWAPRDPSLFLPKLFRDSPPPPSVELPTEDVDDDRLLSAFSVEEGLKGGEASTSEDPQGGLQAQALAQRQQPRRGAQGAQEPLRSVKPAHLDPLAESSAATPKAGSEVVEPSSARRVQALAIQVEEPEAVSEGIPSWKDRPRRVRKRGGVPLLSIEDPGGSMRYFFKRLTQAKSGRKVRVMHYGDSLIAGDYVTSTMRRLLQKRFGYGGLGYTLAGKPSPWYGRSGLKLSSKRWKADRATRSTSSSSSYGLGGVSFRSKSKRSFLRAEVQKQEQIDARVDSFELHYLAQPKGGQLSVRFGPTKEVISTQSETLKPARVIIKAPLGLHTAEVKPVGDGEVRLLGMSLERSGGGLVYDSLGLTGSRAQQQLKWDKIHWIEQARWRSPDLFVIHYGTNESENTRMDMGRYADVLRQVIQRLRAVNPQASCLFVSPMDRAYKDEKSGRIKTRPIIPKIVKTQRKVSLDEGCAFWSTYDAMGGWGSLKRWYRASPPLAGGDLTHPTRRGANLLGAMFFSAMLEAYAKESAR